MHNPNLIVGMDRPDDAGVYRIAQDLALILTLDFFTPIVDDPYDFGQIAVANALSDVYAMGGRPLLAMNIICFPEKTFDIAILQEILRGGSDKMVEAGVLLVGGHSVDDPEIKYGLSVTGTVHPNKVLKNTGGIPGDAVILTKPLGCGIISTAIKADMASKAAEEKAVRSMKTLNRKAAEVMESFNVHACTDVTGFVPGLQVATGSKLPVWAKLCSFRSMPILAASSWASVDTRKPVARTTRSKTSVLEPVALQEVSDLKVPRRGPGLYDRFDGMGAGPHQADAIVVNGPLEIELVVFSRRAHVHVEQGRLHIVIEALPGDDGFLEGEHGAGARAIRDRAHMAVC